MGHIHGVGGAPGRWLSPLMVRAAVTSVILSVLFVIVYGSTNWLTAQRPAEDIQTWYFAWELSWVPYVPHLMIPYMSMDLLFFFAPFLCRDEREVRTYARRVIFSIGVAAAFFLLLPLKLDWPARPPVDGWFGELVEQSFTAPFLMEYPHNLFPSLHIILCMIVAEVYWQRTAGIVRWAAAFWFFLIAASTLLTWQHHLVDVFGGLIVAGWAFYLFRPATSANAGSVNVRIGCYYAAAALTVFVIVSMIGIWGTFLLWPAFALGVTAFAYWGIGPGIFRKADGALPWSTRFVMAPILLGQYLSWLHYRRQCNAWDEVTPSLWIGRALTDAEAASAIDQGVTAVLDLSAEFAAAGPFRDVTYRNLQILDLTAPTTEQLAEAVQFLAKETANGIVYVHCKIGYSRSAAVIAAYLLASGQFASVDEAIAHLRVVRPSIVIRPEVIETLRRFEPHITASAPVAAMS